MQIKTKWALDRITDIFTGVDGGISFSKFKELLEELDNQAVSGDSAAKEILEIVYQFDRLISIDIERYR